MLGSNLTSELARVQGWKTCQLNWPQMGQIWNFLRSVSVQFEANPDIPIILSPA